MASPPDICQVLHFSLQFGHPGRVHHRQVFNPNLGTWKGELDLAGDDLHVDLAVLLQPRPDLVPGPPQYLYLEAGVDPHVRSGVGEVPVEYGHRPLRGLDTGHHQHRGRAAGRVGGGVEQEAPAGLEDGLQQTVGDDAARLVDHTQWGVK